MKDERLLVSIVCLAYNHEKYIRDALEGFLMQKADFRFEVLIHDDASTDNTADIIREYEAIYPDIIKPIYQKENQHSLKIPIGKTYLYPRAQGKYIALCEGDDYWIDPLKLQKQVDFMETHPEYSMCGSNGMIIWEDGLKPAQYFNNCFYDRTIDMQEVIGNWIYPTASLLFRKEISENYPEWTSKIYSGDQTLTLISGYKGKLYMFSDLFCVYRKSLSNKDSMSNTLAKKRNFVQKQHLILYQEYDKYTEGKYREYIDSYTHRLRKGIKFTDLRTTFFLLPFFWNPLYTIKHLWRYHIKEYLSRRFTQKAQNTLPGGTTQPG